MLAVYVISHFNFFAFSEYIFPPMLVDKQMKNFLSLWKMVSQENNSLLLLSVEPVLNTVLLSCKS